MPRDPDEDGLEIYRPPQFLPGTRVRATCLVRNDGTFPGRDIGEVLVKKDDIGFVRDVGTFLQRHYVYAVDFIARGAVVGMRGRELALAERALVPTAAAAAGPEATP